MEGVIPQPATVTITITWAVEITTLIDAKTSLAKCTTFVILCAGITRIWDARDTFVDVRVTNPAAAIVILATGLPEFCAIYGRTGLISATMSAATVPIICTSKALLATSHIYL